MSIRVMTHVWANSEQKGSALLALLAIADHCHDDGGGAYPSMNTLAQKVRMTKRNTQNLVRKLAESGELIVELNAGPNKVNLYIIPMGVQTFHGADTDKGGEVAFMGGVKTSVPGDEAGFTQTIIEPSRETSEQPSIQLTLPTWWQTLSQDKRWKPEIDWGFIRDIDSRFGNLDLMLEARKCYQWAQDSKTGKRRKDLRRTWLNWLDGKDSGRFGENGNKPSSSKPDESGSQEWINRHGLPDPNKSQIDGRKSA